MCISFKSRSLLNKGRGGRGTYQAVGNPDWNPHGKLPKNQENFGYEVTLTKKIYTDNNDKSSLTKNLVAGDVVLYKGNKLILVYKTTTTVYNYTKIGRFLFTNTQSNKIEITFCNNYYISYCIWFINSVTCYNF